MADDTKAAKSADTKSAETKSTPAVPVLGGDRVASLSIRSDGTPDQTNPTFIGDPETTERATREQFRQMAVSAVDERERSTRPDDAPEDVQDPTVAALKAKHDAAARDGEAAADNALKAFRKDG
jgi:hypothetical protein